MRVGFTGSSRGINQDQIFALRVRLRALGATHLHHGDCVHSDAVAHAVALNLGLHITIHPPLNESKQAFCAGADVMLPQKPYLERNHDIVDATKILIATPFENQMRLRSGTWATVRYARSLDRPILILWPDGRETLERFPMEDLFKCVD